jgi:hypothetical protein
MIRRSTEYTYCTGWPALYNGPPSPKFQILLSQLRQIVDRAACLSIKSLWSQPLSLLRVHKLLYKSYSTIAVASGIECYNIYFKYGTVFTITANQIVNL